MYFLNFKSLLISNIITPNSEQCVEFYYFEEISEVGRLNLYARTVINASAPIDPSTLGLPVWSGSYIEDTLRKYWTDAQKRAWTRVQVPLGHAISNRQFQLIFEQFVDADTRGKWFRSYLDDIFIKDESCLPPGDCDFDNGLCMYRLLY